MTPVPTLVASVSDGIAWAQDMLTSVFGTVVPLTQLQSDLYSFLMGIAGAAPVGEVSAASPVPGCRSPGMRRRRRNGR